MKRLFLIAWLCIGISMPHIADATTFYLDYVNGSDANDGSSWAQAWQTITSGATAARIAPGDIIRIAKSPNPTSLGQTATWTNLNRAVTLTSAVTSTVDLAETAWQASSNVTTSTSSTRKEGTYSLSISIESAFTTGKVAYKTLTSTDFSGKQQLSFWIRSSGAISANKLKVVLCSDTTGDTIVDEFIIPVVDYTNRWMPITVDKGSALGSTIQSVALYAIADPGTITVLMDDVIACKASSSADSLTLQSLISKNSVAQGGTEGWYAIQSINDATVLLDADTNTSANAGQGYAGTTESVTTYKRETIKVASAGQFTIMDSGTINNYIEYQGGFNTSTTEQDGESIFDGLDGSKSAFQSLVERSYIKTNYLSFYRFTQGFTGYLLWYGHFSNMRLCNNQNYGLNAQQDMVGCYFAGFFHANNNGNSGILNAIDSTGNIFENAIANNNTNYGFYEDQSSNVTAQIMTTDNNGLSGVNISSSNNNTFNNLYSRNNVSRGLIFNRSADNLIKNYTSSGNGSSSINPANCSTSNYILNPTISEGTIMPAIVWYRGNTKIHLQGLNGDATDNRIYCDGGDVISQTSIRHTASGLAWKLSPTNADVRNSIYPLDLQIAKIALLANYQATIKAWFRRDNTGITGKLAVRGGQCSGITNDVTASMTVAADTWEQLQVQVTPTEDCVIEVEAWAYGGTTYSVYVDDVSVEK